jgi:hypothetical protein
MTSNQPCLNCGGVVPPKSRPGGVPKLYCSEQCGFIYRDRGTEERREHRRALQRAMYSRKAPPFTGFPLPLPGDRSIYTDWLTGCRYVILNGDLLFLNADLNKFLGAIPNGQRLDIIRSSDDVRRMPEGEDYYFLPPEFVPGGARAATVRQAIIPSDRLEGAFRRRRYHDLADYWPGYIADLKRQHGLEEETP